MKPVVIQVFGDKFTKPETEHHRIEFPGGFISLDRCEDGRYWAHIGLNNSNMEPDDYPITHQGSRKCRVVGSRVDFDRAEWARRVNAGEEPIPNIDGMENAQHFAVCIQPTD